MKNVILNPDRESALRIMQGIVTKGGYCPCKVQKTEDNRCPCRDLYEKGVCCCGLYVKERRYRRNESNMYTRLSKCI